VLWSSRVVEVSCSIVVSLAGGLSGGGTWDSGINRVMRSRSRRSRAESNSFGNRTWRVNSIDRSAGEACLRGLEVGGVVVVVVVGEFRELIRDVMKARDCGSVMVCW
jgi:hypothetical protein